VLFLFFCPASVYQQSFLGGEQTAAATATDASAQQYRNQQCKPIRLATFEFDFKKQRSQRQDHDTRTEWKNVSHRDTINSMDIQQKTRQHCDVIDFADSNYNKDEPSFSPEYLKSIDNLSQSMHELIDNLNDNKISQRHLKSRSAASSLNSIPENLTCNYHSSSSIRCDDIIDKTITPEKCQDNQKNKNSPKESKCSNCETPKSSTKSSAENQRDKHNRKSLYNANRDSKFDTDDFRNPTASTSTDSLTGGSSTGNDIETSDSFVNIQFARLACGQKSSSTQSMESTDSFENVSFRYKSTSNRPSQIPLKLAIGSDRNKSSMKMLQNRIAALNVSKLPKFDNQPDRKNYNSLKTQETGKCIKNEPVKLRHERYVNKKSQMDPRNTRSKRYSCFSPFVTKRSSEEIGAGDDKITQRKFSSTDELRDQNEQRQQKPITRTKRFSLYYTPQPLRKTYENETKTGRVVVKSISRVHKSEVHKGRSNQEPERTDKSRRSVIDASTVASRSKSNRQNVHVKSNIVVNTNRTK